MTIHSQTPIIIFGGTFNPIHFGHLRLADTIHNLLPSSTVHFVPSANPPHRPKPTISIEQRFEMLQLAIEDTPYFVADNREMVRKGASYSVDTLRSFAEEFPNRPLIWVMGDDAFAQFHTWKDWQQILSLSHIVVIARPGYNQLTCENDVRSHVRCVSSVEDLVCESHGSVLRVNCPLLEISSSQIRDLLRKKQSCRFLLPDSVIKYMHQHQLYG